MSEKLAALGRLGAEELADVLNLLFSALLSDAAAYGGSLLKYGGDAVLLFFEGEDHAARGVAATHRMRATLRRIGTVKTSRGTVRVRMSVGVHSDEFDFFLVGASHRELIVAGPGATATVDMEAEADAGQILLSPATAALLPASCVGERKGAGYLLKRCPRAEARDALAWGHVPDADPVPFIPVGLRNHVGGVGADAEHRHIAVGFVAFGGVDELLARDGGERTAVVLDEFIGACQEAFDRYGVCFLYADVYGDGGKVFFLSGAPVSHEDNEERILRAALEISAQHFQGLHLHTGLNRGYVFAGDIGAEFRRTYTVLGDAVNTAARVMASCNEDGQVRTMPEVLDLASSRFDTEKQTPFAAKGKALPLETFAVGEPLGPRLSDTPLPLVGRDRELSSLQARLTGVKAGRGGVVRIVGDAGVGKSRLVQELVATADAEGFATVTTFAERYEQSTVYFMLRQLFAIVFDGAEHDATKLVEVATELAPTERAWFPLLGSVLGLDIEPTRETLGLSDNAIPAALGRLTVALLDGFLDGPSLWVAENAHLVDAASAGVIETVVGELEKRSWLLMPVLRTEEPTGLSALRGDEFVVGRLAADDAARLARTANPTLLPTDAVAIAERSDGNPLFLRQLVTAASDGGELSDSVETAVSSRIDRLSTGDRDVLRTAAVLGGRFELGALRELLRGRSPDLAPLNDFVSVTENGVIFRQALYREVAYAGLTFRRRRDLHLAAGRLLESDIGDEDNAPFGRLSLHFHQAQAWELSWKYSVLAGDHAAFGADAKAVGAAFYARALEAGRHLPNLDPVDMARVAGDYGHALYNAGRVEEARRALKLGRRYAPKESVEMAYLLMREGAFWHDAGEARRARKWFRQGLAVIDQCEEDLTTERAAEARVNLLCGTSMTTALLGDIETGLALAAQAATVANELKFPRLIAVAHSLRMMLAHAVGDTATAITEGELAVEATRLDPRFLGMRGIQTMNLGVLYFEAGEFTRALAMMREARGAQQVVGNDIMAAVTDVNIAELLLDQGEWKQTATILDDCQQVLAMAEDEAEVFARLIRMKLVARTAACEDSEFPPMTVSAGLPELMSTARIEVALSKGDVAGARLHFDSARAEGIEMRWAEIYDAVIRRAEGVLSSDELRALSVHEKPIVRVVANAMLGHQLDSVDDAQKMGVIDVPAWAKPI